MAHPMNSLDMVRDCCVQVFGLAKVSIPISHTKRALVDMELKQHGGGT